MARTKKPQPSLTVQLPYVSTPDAEERLHRAYKMLLDIGARRQLENIDGGVANAKSAKAGIGRYFRV